MSTITTNQWEINGVIDTSQSVISNLTKIANASGCFLTWDSSEGTWSVVLNDIGTSVYSFNDTNIIGNINVSGSGISEMYNSVTIEFPHKDLRDTTDYIDLNVPTADRYTQELDNVLTITTDLVNDPIQAALIASRELNQSRLDKTIEFRTDYIANGLKAGDLIDVTNTAYGYSSKVFRIIQIEEDDTQEGSIIYSIVALEYDADVYSTAGLERTYRSKKTGIVPKAQNTALTASDNQASLPLDLTDYAAALGLLLSFNNLTGRYELSQGSSPVTLQNTSGVVLNWTFNPKYEAKQDVTYTPVDVLDDDGNTTTINSVSVLNYVAGDDGGRDLDIRCRIVYPNVGQYSVDDSLGFTGGGGSLQFPTGSTRYWPTSGSPIIQWGGDNTGVGQESVLLDLNAFKYYYPQERYVIVECRGNWYNTVGSNPVKLNSTLYQGGTFVLNDYTFTNPTATGSRYLDGLEIYINSNYGSTLVGGYWGGNAPGDLMGYFVFDVQTYSGQFTFDLNSFTG